MLGDVCFCQAEEIVCYVGIIGVLQRIEERHHKSIGGRFQKTRWGHDNSADGVMEGSGVDDAGVSSG